MGKKWKKKLVLLYEPNVEKRKAIEQLCQLRNVHVKFLTAKDMDRTVGELVEVSGSKVLSGAKGEKAPALFLLPEVLIFSGFADGELDDFLEAYRQAGIETIGLKAIVTPYNVGWSLYGLVTELMKEHKSF